MTLETNLLVGSTSFSTRLTTSPTDASENNHHRSNVLTLKGNKWPTHDQQDVAQQDLPADHFIERNGIEYAGTHLIIDLWGAKKLDQLNLMEETLIKAITEAKATLLHIHLHHFTPNGGISGVAVLAESHISVHTWPERNFAAFDVFMCGIAEPERVIPILKQAFSPDEINLIKHLRGAPQPK